MNWYKKAQSDPNQKTIDNFNRNKASKEPYYRSWQLVPIEELKKFREYDRTETPLLNKKRYEELKTDIIINGIKDPIIIQYNTKNKTARIGEGNHRLAIAKELGITVIPVKVWTQDYLYPHSDSSFPPYQITNLPEETSKEKYYDLAGQDISPSRIGIKTIQPDIDKRMEEDELV